MVFADERLNDIVGSAYYVAPEVLHRSYSLEADIWSIGIITYILLCGSRPFWARTESGIFRAVLRSDPNFEDLPWPSVTPEAKDFVKRLLNKDYRKRMTAVQALSKLVIPLLLGENIPMTLTKQWISEDGFASLSQGCGILFYDKKASMENWQWMNSSMLDRKDP